MCMGSNLGPTMAAFIMDKIENQMSTTPKFYCRYVDDIFIIASSSSEADDFLTDINKIHPNIQFTKENETDRKLTFLDVEICREDQRFATNWHIKSTNTGQYLHKHAFAPQTYKYAAIKSLIYRAFRLCSYNTGFEEAYKIIRNIFVNLGYHYKVIEKIKNNVIGKLFCPSIANLDDKKTIYFSLPFIEKLEKTTKQMMSNINSVIGPEVQVKLAYKTKKSQSFFTNKDKIPSGLRANVVYKFSCGHGCDRVYIGETSRHLATRTREHITGRPVPSEVALHEHKAEDKDFTVLSITKYPTIAEAIFYFTVPADKRLNKYQPPFQLQLFNFPDATTSQQDRK